MFNDVNLIGTCKSIEKVEHEISHTKIGIDPAEGKVYDVYLFGYIQDIAKDINVQVGDLICVQGCLEYFDDKLLAVKAGRLVVLAKK